MYLIVFEFNWNPYESIKLKLQVNHPLKHQSLKPTAVLSLGLDAGSTAQERVALGATRVMDVVTKIQTGPTLFATRPFPVAWNVAQNQTHSV